MLQGANLSRVLMGQARMNLFTMLLSAIILHGSFDCSLFIMAAIAFVNDISGIWFEILTYLVACLIAGVGSWYAYQQYTRVIDDWEEAFINWLTPRHTPLSVTKRRSNFTSSVFHSCAELCPCCDCCIITGLFLVCKATWIQK